MIVGTSTGAIMAVGLGTFHYSLDQMEGIYTSLGAKIFNSVRGGERGMDSMMEHGHGHGHGGGHGHGRDLGVGGQATVRCSCTV